MTKCIAKCQNIGGKITHIMNAPMRMISALIVSFQATLLTMAPALCSASGLKGVTMDGIFNGIVEIVTTIAFYCGAVIAMSGVFQLVMAYRNDDSEGQTRAIRLLIVGLLLVGFDTILAMIGIK